MALEGSYLSKRGYVIRKENLQDGILHELKRELRGIPLQDDKFNFFNRVDTSFPLYVETKNKLYIPKMYGIERYGMPKQVTDNYVGEDIDVEFNGELYPSQVSAVNTLLGKLQDSASTGGILSLMTGGGKTTCALYAISRLKKKTLIIVNKVALMKQWESEIQKFLPEATIGFIQGQKNVKVDGVDIVIGMLQSLSRIDYPDALFESFGCICVDETHNICSKIFSKILMKTSCKYTIGLSATPKRSDGCEYIFKWFLGDVVYKSQEERRGLPPILQTITINSKEYKEESIINKITGQKQIMFTTMLSNLVNMEKRNQLIVEVVKDLILNESRKVLVLSDRREHLKALYSLLDQDVSVTFTYGLFIGQMKVEDLERSKACNLILATYGCFSEGVSEKDLDTLVLITPKKFIGHLKNTKKNESGKLEQIVGRIFRKEHTSKNPKILDIQDNFSVFKNQSKQRMTFYREHFSNLETIHCTIDLDKHDNIDIKCLQVKKTSIQSNQYKDICFLD